MAKESIMGITIRKALLINAVKKVYPLVIFVAVFGLICYGVFYLLIVPKTPAAAEQVIAALISHGYEPQDITEQYIAQNPDTARNLRQCVTAEKEDVHFEFYSFYNEKSAVNLYSTAFTLIIRTKMGTPNVEIDKKIANYCKYTLKASGTYSVAMYVGTTAVYAYSSAENWEKIDYIPKEIDY